MNIHMTVPEGGTLIDPLVDRYRGAFEKIANGQSQIKVGRTQLKEGRAIWIEGTLELAVVVAETRINYPDHMSFSLWLRRYDLAHLNPNDRLALYGFSRDLQAARAMLEASSGISWRSIWEKQNKGRKSGPSQIDKGLISTPKGKKGNDAGSRKRKRAAVIPECMRDDYVPGEITKRAAEHPAQTKRRRRVGARAVDTAPPRERPVPKLKGLTPEQVDPDFKGTPLEFAAKYGLVNLQTKQQIEHHKRQEELMAWLGVVSEHERTARAVLTAAVDPETLREWMSKPAKNEKLRAWCSSIQLACETIRKIAVPADKDI